MFHSRWLNNCFGVARSRKDHRRESRRTRKSVRLMLESLEDRLTPSQTAGSYGELVQDVAADTGSNTSYVIQITNSFTFAAGGQVNISKLGIGSSLTIKGGNSTLTGNGNRLFDIGPAQVVEFDNLTLTGGSVTSTSKAEGGAILGQGAFLSLDDVTVEGNTVKGPQAGGGGVCLSGNGKLSITGGSTIKSNSAIGTGAVSTLGGGKSGGLGSGGGVFVFSSSGFTLQTVTISDSSISNNHAQGGQGPTGAGAAGTGLDGGLAYGGGLYVDSGVWTTTLTGDTFSGNTATGGKGGTGAAGTISPGGHGSNGGDSGGGAAFFFGGGQLTILNDSTHSSTMLDNSTQAGAGGNGGDSTQSQGGDGGNAGTAYGGAIDFPDPSGSSESLTANIGNTTLDGNNVSGNIGGKGGKGALGDGVNGQGNLAGGGGMAVAQNISTITLVNSTVANNTVTNSQDSASGGGVYMSSTTTLDNNTITQNRVAGIANGNNGGGIFLGNANPTLVNNLIVGNQSAGSSVPDLQVESRGTTLPLANATNNFIGIISPNNAVNPLTNTVGDTTAQLGNVVGFDSKGNPTGGPIYYPLLSGVASVDTGSTGVLSTIAGVEGTSAGNATDEIGNPRSSDGKIDLGAVEFASSGSSSAPVITAQPTNQTVSFGQSATFTASASGSPTPTVQWQFSVDGGKTFVDLAGATSTTLTLLAIEEINGEQLRAVFTNSAGSVTSNVAVLNITGIVAPVVTSNPVNQSVKQGANVSFTSSASGTQPIAVLWQVSTDGGKTWTIINGANSTTLTLNNVTTAMNGNEYRAAFGNLGVLTTGLVFSNAATLHVSPNTAPPPAPLAPPPPLPPPIVPPVLQLIDGLLSGLGGTMTQTMNANGNETVTDTVFGIPLLVATFNSSGQFVDATLLGFDVTFLVKLF